MSDRGGMSTRRRVDRWAAVPRRVGICRRWAGGTRGDAGDDGAEPRQGQSASRAYGLIISWAGQRRRRTYSVGGQCSWLSRELGRGIPTVRGGPPRTLRAASFVTASAMVNQISDGRM